MGIMHFNYRSGALGYYVNIAVALPTDGLAYDESATVPGKAPEIYTPGMKFQTVYLISGGGEDESVPFRYMPVERWACENKVMVVCPEVTNSFGVNTQYGINYMKFITEELPVVIRTLLPSSPEREDNFVMGYGMGGNVALGLAIMHPEMYSACLDVDGGIGMTLDTEQFAEELNGDLFRKVLPLLISTFVQGSEMPGSEYDLYAIAQANLEKGGPQPVFILAAGLRGHVWKRVQTDAELLQTLGYSVTYLQDAEYGHSFDMFGKYLHLGLAELLPLKRKYLYPEKREDEEKVPAYYTVTKLNENSYRIQGSKNESMYLLVGEEQALLVDTGMEDASLLEEVKKLTDKPVVLALTHGHLDHIGRSIEFDPVYLRDEDREIYMAHTNILSQMSPDCTNFAKPVEAVRSMPKQFRLGGLDVDAVALPGHTPGSVIFVDKKNRCVFTGDAIGSGDGVVLAVEGALSVSDYRDGLRRAEKALEELGVTEDWYFYGGHSGKEYLSQVSECNLPSMKMLRDMIVLCDRIIDGTAELEERKGSPFDPDTPSVYVAHQSAEMHFFRNHV